MPETDENMIANVLELLKNKQYAALRKVLDDLNPADIAEAMETIYDDGDINNDELVRLYRLLPK
ncbi:MAG: hypothetical protein IKI73_00845, partial [Firmicutes bacterium]|nr:hypothetical protein [Bacillota bacterium]